MKRNFIRKLLHSLLTWRYIVELSSPYYFKKQNFWKDSNRFIKHLRKCIDVQTLCGCLTHYFTEQNIWNDPYRFTEHFRTFLLGKSKK